MPGLFFNAEDGGNMLSGPSLNYITIHRTIFSTVTAIRTLNATTLIHITETDVTDNCDTIT
jgi:hypothetical protein